jgi:hypothetical protein
MPDSMHERHVFSCFMEEGNVPREKKNILRHSSYFHERSRSPLAGVGGVRMNMTEQRGVDGSSTTSDSSTSEERLFSSAVFGSASSADSDTVVGLPVGDSTSPWLWRLRLSITWAAATPRASRMIRTAAEMMIRASQSYVGWL